MTGRKPPWERKPWVKPLTWSHIVIRHDVRASALTELLRSLEVHGFDVVYYPEGTARPTGEEDEPWKRSNLDEEQKYCVEARREELYGYQESGQAPVYLCQPGEGQTE